MQRSRWHIVAVSCTAATATSHLPSQFLLPRFARCTCRNEFWWCHNDNIKCYLNCTAYKHAHSSAQCTGLPNHKAGTLFFIRWFTRSLGRDVPWHVILTEQKLLLLYADFFCCCWLVALDGMSEMCYVCFPFSFFCFCFIFVSHKLAIFVGYSLKGRRCFSFFVNSDTDTESIACSSSRLHTQSHRSN